MKIKIKKTSLLLWLFAIYSASVITQNVLASKQIDILGFTVTTGILVSPFVFIVQDIVSEIFNFKVARKMIISGFLCNFFAVLLFALAIALPGSMYWSNQEAFSAVLGTTFRISVASFSAYMIGSLINTKIMTTLKEKFPKSLLVRAISSTLVGQFLDNVIFSFGAFLFVLPVPAIWTMVLGATIFEVSYEVILYPVMKMVINFIKKHLGKE